MPAGGVKCDITPELITAGRDRRRGLAGNRVKWMPSDLRAGHTTVTAIRRGTEIVHSLLFFVTIRKLWNHSPYIPMK